MPVVCRLRAAQSQLSSRISWSWALRVLRSCRIFLVLCQVALLLLSATPRPLIITTHRHLPPQHMIIRQIHPYTLHHHLPRIIHHLLIMFLQCLMSLLPRQQSSTHHHLQSTLHLTPLLITLQSTPHQFLQLIAIVLHHLVVTPMLLRPQYSMRRQQLLITTILDQLHISGGY
jgi:hypothetical protein